jgi:hypothetical protein
VTRAVRAVLIGVRDSAWTPGQAATHAIATAQQMGQFLQTRFTRSTTTLLTSGGGNTVTRADVIAAFATARPAPGELFVVLFCGHGIPASRKHPFQAWALTDDEFTDIDLAAQLRAFPAGVESVVISDCCYGRGFLDAGAANDNVPIAGDPVRPGAPPLRTLSRTFATRLRAHADQDNVPMVCISAAGATEQGGGLVLESVAAELIRGVTEAAQAELSYEILREKFRSERFSGREFHVDARPETRLTGRVLGTEPVASA